MASKKFFAGPEELEAAYLETKSVNKMAVMYGVSKKLILNYMVRYGIQTDNRDIERHREMIVALAGQGKTSREASEITGMSEVHVNKLARTFGVKFNDTFHVGYVTTYNGYIMVKCAGHREANGYGYVREHRLVMEEKLGRLLEPIEIVHHIDGNKQNNSPDNLEVMTRGDHVSLHHKGKKGHVPDKKPRSMTMKI